MNFSDRLAGAVERTGNPVLLGIDPHLDLLPEEFAVARDRSARRVDRAKAVARFCLELVELAKGRVPAVKPQAAFFEELGADGVAAFEEVVDAARDASLLVVGDVKRGDIASTAAAYARAHLAENGGGRCDAITVSPYLGADSLEPFIEAADANEGGLFVLVRTSNPGGTAWQTAGDVPIAGLVADQLTAWGAERLGECGLSNLGAVVGATQAAELAQWRERLPHAWMLLPGYGAQGAGAADVVGAFRSDGLGALVASSRGIAFAYAKDPAGAADWRGAADRALDAMIADLRSAVPHAG
ncbi:orotidine-5'-phosphate decarboxylase [Engelhardtia mirabilis]|uniref:Orotidine 5'-phosphate decarboxylase n=1 Tax=Engelhardtia mirabilis TaxID=2528011 RepID=A0A518BT22_9BACT|nr:Orotidine 5'-phosphate decarboxylase [Planctomycetes bacterium Pla133]QDV04448.1 Orotidine 5'-phosphate decarboxylase [Planctomycetes bacterium Pla86]